MAKQTILWTALPKGIRNGKLQLSTVVSPRLTSTQTRPTLRDFPDLARWPSIPVEFRVQFAKGPTLPARRVGPEPDLNLWEALFPQAETYVRPYTPDRGSSAVISYPVRNVVGYVENRYRRLALDYPTRLPPTGRLLDPEYFGEVRLRSGLKTELKQLQAQTRREQAAMVAQAMAAAAAALTASDSEETEPKQKRTHQPITPPPESSTGGRNRSPLPTGLEEHIRGVIDKNRSLVGEQISRGFGEFGQTDPTAPLPFERPVSRPGEEDLPVELPILFPIDTAPDPLRDFLKAGLFHLGLMPEFTGDPEDREVQPMPMLPELDFHQLIGILMDYPTLARQLGLIVDLEVDLMPDVPTPSLCRVLPNWSPQVETVNLSPWTHYEIRDGRFLPRARPTNPEVRDGMLNLTDRDAFAFIQIDPDSAARVVLQRIDSWIDPTKPEEAAGLPPLHSAGIALARSGAGILLLQAFVTTKLHNELLDSRPDQVAFWAEDLVQGYRPDIWWKEKDRWYSLTSRVGTYRFLRTGHEERIEDEGWVTLAASGGVSATATDLHLHEMMFSWHGWSLAIPEPELEEDNAADQGEAEDPGSSLQMAVDFVPPVGSLPMLRFGHTYRVRVRTVDLAGNSLPFARQGDEGASEEITYRRLEPIGSPILIPPAPLWVPPEERGAEPPAATLTKGELPNLMVVRTGDDGVADGTRRHVAPPPVTLKQAELHGVFDTDQGLDRARYSEALDHDGEFQPYEPNVTRPLDIPYLPDPIARYVIFEGLPGYPEDKAYKVELGNLEESWPHLQTIRITAKVGAGAPEYRKDSRELVIYVPEYGEYEVKVSCGFYERDLDLMYLWHLLTRDLDPVLDQRTLADLRAAALDGKHWMLTPATTLKLVHAVQRPKDAPEILAALAHRKPGETSTMLSGRIRVHAQSTRSVLVHATWSETIDDESADGPETSTGESFAFEEQVQGREVLEVHHRQEWSDTRYRKVYYKAVGTSRFAEYFELDDPTAFQKAGADFAVDVLSAAPPAPPQVEYIVPTFGWTKPVDARGDQIVSMRKGGGLRVYLRRPWFSSGEGEMLGVILSEQLDAGGRVPEDQRPYVTHWAKDPLWQAEAPDLSPRMEHFRNAAANQRGLTLRFPQEDGRPERTMKVAVVGYPVHYDAARKLWYADIELEVGKAYFPFIRLALARYQPKSVEGCHLSDVVLTDFVQVVPDRATSIVYRANDELVVNVNGQTYAWGPAGPAVVEVTVECTSEPGDEALSWQPCEGLSPVTLVRRHGSWNGTVYVPRKAGERYRLIVSEYEQYLGDDNKLTRRLVFADVLEV